MMYSLLCLLLLTTASAYAGTHVNISFSQEHTKNAGHVSDLSMGELSQYKSSAVEQFRTNGQLIGNQHGRSARLEVEEKDNGQTVKYANHKSEGSSVDSVVVGNSHSHSADQVETGQLVAQLAHNHHRGMYNTNPIEYQRNAQFRKMSDQQKQNMEFERYIHHYHSGPTVETVYESADAMPAHSSSSRVNEGSHAQRSGRIVKFERQVALPAAISNDADKQVQHQNVQTAESVVSSPASSSSSSSVSVSTASGNNLKINLNPRPASVGSDGLNFDQSTSYNTPNYKDANNYKYSDDESATHFHNQYPPSVGEPQGGFGGYFTNKGDSHYYGNGYSQPQVNGHNYLPPEATEQRHPVVTKTIQIAQPAIKTKKYEVRHPAIQKEFYDIEERVLIKPAGTVVVELERPVAKIPKGESILPLGHPHPAVAGAYMNNGNDPSFSNFVYSTSGSNAGHNQANNQYHGSSTVYNNKPVSEHRSNIASTITSTPNFDQSSKEAAVEANLNKQYSGESHFTASPAPVVEESKSRSREVIVVTNAQGHQRQVSPDQFSYSRDETDRAPARSGYNLRSYSNHNVAPQRTNFQQGHAARNEYDFEAEYINNAGSGNIQRESKPARLEVAPVRMTERQQQPIIKHEHNIHLAPSQHKIYLTQKEEVPQSRYVEERARVQEVKPYLLNHPGPVVVYAPSKQRAEVSFRQSGSEYQPQSQVVHYRSAGGNSNVGSERSGRLEVSAPYAQMRYHPDSQFVGNSHNYRESQFSHNDRENRKSGNLIVEEKQTDEVKSSSQSTAANLTEPQTHIQISIPHSSRNSNKPITVSSTIRPMMSDDGDEVHNAKLEISVTNNGEPKKDQMDVSNIDTDSSERLANSQAVVAVDCDKTTKLDQYRKEEKFMRIVESASDTNKEGHSAAETTSSNIQANNVDVSNKGTTGHVAAAGSGGHAATAGSRVIAATPAPKDFSSASESFHKRRIVVNHPFQTVREVVEHEPYTNYHEVQVNEPASPALYHSAAYFQTHGALRQADSVGHEQRHLAGPVYYH